MGHLVMRGDALTPRVFRNPRATDELLTADHFIRTGDAAIYDVDGYIYIVDRISDLIKFNDRLICPSELETIVRQHPGIDDCALIAINNERISSSLVAATMGAMPPQSNCAALAIFIVRNAMTCTTSQISDWIKGILFEKEFGILQKKKREERTLF